MLTTLICAPVLRFNPKVMFTSPPRKIRVRSKEGREGRRCKAKLETCIVLHARVGLLEGIRHRGALSWEEKRREEENQEKGGDEGGRRCGGAELLPPFHSAGAERIGDATRGGISMGSLLRAPSPNVGLGDPLGGCRGVTWVGVDAVGVDGLGGGLPVALRGQRAEAVHPDGRRDAGHRRRADAGGGARTCGIGGGVSAGNNPREDGERDGGKTEGWYLKRG